MTARVALIDYGSGNLRSAEKALARAAAELGSGQNIVVTSRPEEVADAERIVLPGVGAFADCMRGLSAIPGMIEAMERRVLKQGGPFLGICVGMQLLADTGHEHGHHKGLGWIAGDVTQMQPEADGHPLKVPHMGWNALAVRHEHPLLDGMAGSDVYFVHSYAIHPSQAADVLAEADYGGPITAVVGRNNIAGTQFHPEKSQSAGLAFLSRFLEWRP